MENVIFNKKVCYKLLASCQGISATTILHPNAYFLKLEGTGVHILTFPASPTRTNLTFVQTHERKRVGLLTVTRSVPSAHFTSRCAHRLQIQLLGYCSYSSTVTKRKQLFVHAKAHRLTLTAQKTFRPKHVHSMRTILRAMKNSSGKRAPPF